MTTAIHKAARIAVLALLAGLAAGCGTAATGDRSTGITAYGTLDTGVSVTRDR